MSSLLPWTRMSHAKQEKNTASWGTRGSNMDGPGARHREGTHPPPVEWPTSKLCSIENRNDRTVEEVSLESHVHSPGNASAGCGVARETRYLIILSVGSPGEPCYDARATASSPRILLPGVGALAAFFIRQITFQPSAPGPTLLARNPPNQSVNQQVRSCPSRPATKRQRPRQLPPSSSIHHHSSTNDPTHVSRAPSTTSVNFQTTLTKQPKTPSKCLPSPPTRSPPLRLPSPPRPPRRRMPLARRLPPLARRRSAPRRGRRPTPPTSTRVSSFFQRHLDAHSIASFHLFRPLTHFAVLKQVHPDTGISNRAMSILNSFVNGESTRPSESRMPITDFSRHLRARRDRGFQARCVQQEVHHLLPGNPDLRPPHPARRVGQARRV